MSLLADDVQAVDLGLLAHDNGVELLDGVLGEAGLDLQLGDALFQGVQVGIHAPIIDPASTNLNQAA